MRSLQQPNMQGSLEAGDARDDREELARERQEFLENREWEAYKACFTRGMSQEADLSFLGEDDTEILAMEEPATIPFTVTWDTGAVDHVASRADVPGYEVEETEDSRKGRHFLTANGKRIPQEG